MLRYLTLQRIKQLQTFMGRRAAARAAWHCSSNETVRRCPACTAWSYCLAADARRRRLKAGGRARFLAALVAEALRQQRLSPSASIC